MSSSSNDPLVFASSWSGSRTGIHALRLNPASGVYDCLAFTETHSPFYFCCNQAGTRLYAIDNFSGSAEDGGLTIAAYDIDRDSGALAFRNRQGSAGKAGCYVALDGCERHLLLSNYTSGEVEIFPVGDNGSLEPCSSTTLHEGRSVNPERQMEPHPHSIISDPAGRFVFAADLGIDQVVIYRLDPESHRLTPNAMPFARTLPGAGPRHMIFDHAGRHFYVVNELHNSVTLYDYDADHGYLLEQDTVPTLPPDFDGVSHTADLRLTPDGAFLYATNRGHDSLAIFAVDPESGALSPVDIVDSRGEGPQNMRITGDGEVLLVANMPGNNLVTYRIDKATGRLAPLGEALEIPEASCIAIVERGGPRP